MAGEVAGFSPTLLRRREKGRGQKPEEMKKGGYQITLDAGDSPMIL